MKWCCRIVNPKTNEEDTLVVEIDMADHDPAADHIEYVQNAVRTRGLLPKGFMPISGGVYGLARRRTKSAKWASIAAAVNAIWGGTVPDELSKQQRNNQILKWQKANGLETADERTLRRYFLQL